MLYKTLMLTERLYSAGKKAFWKSSWTQNTLSDRQKVQDLAKFYINLNEGCGILINKKAFMGFVSHQWSENSPR